MNCPACFSSHFLLSPAFLLQISLFLSNMSRGKSKRKPHRPRRVRLRSSRSCGRRHFLVSQALPTFYSWLNSEDGLSSASRRLMLEERVCRVPRRRRKFFSRNRSIRTDDVDRLQSGTTRRNTPELGTRLVDEASTQISAKVNQRFRLGFC